MSELNDIAILICVVIAVNIFVGCAIYWELNSLHWELKQLKKEKEERDEQREYQPKPSGNFGYQPVGKPLTPPSPPSSGSNITQLQNNNTKLK